MANQNPTSTISSSALLEALRSAGAKESLIYNAVDEVRVMAGDNVSAAIDTLKAEINGNLDILKVELVGRFDTKIAEINGRLDTQAAETRMNRWMLFAFFAVATAIGLFKG